MDPFEQVYDAAGPEEIASLAGAVPEAELADTRSQAEARARELGEGIASSSDPGADADRIEALVAYIAAIDARVAGFAADRTRAMASLSSLSTPTPDPVPAPDPAPEAGAVVAAAPAFVRAADPDPPESRGGSRRALVAAAGLDATAAGSVFADGISVAREMTNALNRLQPGVPGNPARQIVGAIREYDRPVRLGDDGNLNEAALLNLQKQIQRGDFDRSAITAATGPFCAPSEPIYEMFSLPIGGLVQFPTVDAPRGRRTYPVSPSLVDITGDWEAALGSQNDPKDCFLVVCGDTVDGSVVSYPLCLTFDNFTGRFYPELVEDRIAKSVARFGFVVQGALLNTVQSSLATGLAISDGEGGFLVALQRALRAAGARYRGKHFLPPGFRLDVLLPSWVPEAIAVDIVSRDSTITYGNSVAAITAALEDGGFNIQWVNGWQTVPVTGWETTALNALMYAPGTLVRLSGGELNLGVQRDATLNRANQYQIFQETWDGIVKVGYEVSELTGIVVCANGATGNREAITCDTLTSGS